MIRNRLRTVIFLTGLATTFGVSCAIYFFAGEAPRIGIQRTREEYFLYALATGLVISIAVALFSRILLAGLFRPLDSINTAIERISNGDFDDRLEPSESNDFAGMIQNLNKLTQELRRKEEWHKESQLLEAAASDREEHDLLIEMLGEQLSKVTDVDLLLHLILNSALKFSKCEAGSIWVVDQDQLVLWYSRNLVLEARTPEIHPGIINARIPISERSIAGHCAVSKTQIVLDDVHDLPPDSPFHFDQSFDQKTGFQTRCMISIPLLGAQGAVLGVMQLINPTEHKTLTGTSLVDRAVSFAVLAGQVLERANNAKELLMRLVRTAEVRDPQETGVHVQRVSGVACHLYKLLADKNKLPPDVRDQNISVLRVAAFLHDIGKVGIPDAILKKPGKLDEHEFGLMKWHTVIGAKLFDDSQGTLEKAATEVALHHHERWDGHGYPGAINFSLAGRILDELQDTPHLNSGLKGDETPIYARLVGLADVFDALASVRAYKVPWTDEQIKNEIARCSGTHFDPEIVDVFLANYSDLKAIRERYQYLEKKPRKA